MESNEAWLRRFRLSTMAFLEQRIAHGEDRGEDTTEVRQTLEYFEQRVNEE